VEGAMKITFTVYGKCEPQGSTRAFMPKGWTRPIITSDNSKLKPWRQQLTATALATVDFLKFGKELPFPKGAPVHLVLRFYLEKPASVSKRRVYPTVKPDSSKLLRAVEDSLTGTIWHDDAQVVSTIIEKHYGIPQRVEIEVCEAGCANLSSPLSVARENCPAPLFR
jgi:Holliday junction resolvase RusA-like endonuclease